MDTFTRVNLIIVFQIFMCKVYYNRQKIIKSEIHSFTLFQQQTSLIS